MSLSTAGEQETIYLILSRNLIPLLATKHTHNDTIGQGNYCPTTASSIQNSRVRTFDSAD